ncbi:MAG TPA: dTMP kinase [Thermoanaerobaculaceae bacterium]|nr:dTMP kinase [Thermoanaerobaculaceae bacterium]
MTRGRFITFEGIEGCGKTTQLLLLASDLKHRGVTVVTTREPGGTPLGERVRDVLLDPQLTPIPLVELFLLEAARAQLVAFVIAPALASGKFVLSDRFADSSLAYQGGARRLPRSTVQRLNELACAGVVPDRTLVFDLDVELALGRARERPSTGPDNRRFEDEALAFHRAVAEAYRELARADPGRVTIVDARGTPEEVHGRTLAALAGVLP